MQVSSKSSRLELPASLRSQMFAYRRRVWTVKLIEAGAGALLGALVAFLAMFALDRFFDTPVWVRAILFAAIVCGGAMLPTAMYRWVWRHRKLDQLARLLRRKHPSVGDQLLGVVELAESDTEQARSRALCEAAIQQVANVASQRNLNDAAPRSTHRLRLGLAAVAGVIVAVLGVTVPDATRNAWARVLMPWKDTPRYTFTKVAPLPDRLVVPYGESYKIVVQLADATAWRPDESQVHVAGQQPASAKLRDGAYQFTMPGQIDPAWLTLRVGDVRQRIRIEPTLRPELTSVLADVKLPDYLGHSQPASKDVRGGVLSLVQGSQVKFLATANRKLAAATVDGKPRKPAGAKVASTTTDVANVEDVHKVEFRWRDQFGLSGREPFVLSVSGRVDEAPSLVCEDLPRQKVVLDSEVLTFQVRTQDDFGVRQVGMEWQGADETAVKTPAKGEQILAAGDHELDTLDCTGTFSAVSLGIEPQPLHVRLFVEDYLPGRERIYSPTYVLYVLNAEQHAIWLTEQLSKWHRQALEVRDREMQLFEVNQQLRSLTAEEIDLPANRQRIETQAAAESANGRRLNNLVASGEDLVRQAARNPEFGVGHLENWAEMLQILKDISANRMPSVADLLKQASQAAIAASAGSNSAPVAGQVRASPPGSASMGSPGAKKTTRVPTIVDIESSQQPADPNAGGKPSPGGSSSPRLGLPQTALLGGKPGSGTCPPADAIDEAVKQQQDLLAEFEKIADELNRILANLEGSTLVKRLKAASRQQGKVAGRLGDQVDDAFGVEVTEAAPQTKLLDELASEETESSHNVSTIMDDLASYFDRRRMVKFRDVLDEMRQADVIGNLRQLADDLRKENSLSMAQCEFWSDNLDRWAEDLVDPASGGC